MQTGHADEATIESGCESCAGGTIEGSRTSGRRALREEHARPAERRLARGSGTAIARWRFLRINSPSSRFGCFWNVRQAIERQATPVWKGSWPPKDGPAPGPGRRGHRHCALANRVLVERQHELRRRTPSVTCRLGEATGNPHGTDRGACQPRTRRDLQNEADECEEELEFLERFKGINMMPFC